MILKRDRALTLIEVIIVVFLFSIIPLAIFSALASAKTSWQSSCSQLNVQQEARRGIRAMSRELRQAQLSTIAGVPPDGLSYNSITFRIPVAIGESGTTWSSNIQYSLGGIDSSQLLRTQNGGQRVMANNISALTFSRNAMTPETIDISITSQKNTFSGFSISRSNITLDSEVEVRN